MVGSTFRWTLYYLRKGQLPDARNMLERMPDRGPHGRVGHWTSLLSRFSRFGFIDEAKSLFDIMPQKNQVTYNAMLSGLVQSGRISEACSFFERMPERNVVSWTSMLCGYANAGRIDEAKRLFSDMPERNVVSWNAMVVGLIRNGNLEEAKWIFDAIPVRNVISWNAMISGYTENFRMEEARVLFEQMEERNVVTWTIMVTGYCRIGNVEEAHTLFKKIPEQNVVSWTAMIGGYAWNGFYRESLNIGSCSAQLCNLMINGYIRSGQLEKAKIFFVTAPMCDRISWTSMIDGYLSVGQVSEARELFDVMPDRDSVAWTAIISGYVHNELIPEAIELFSEMRTQGFHPLNLTYATLIGAAGAVANLDQGKQYHSLLLKSNFEHDLIVQNSLISMYAKCGEIDDAHSIFMSMIVRDIVTWNSMIMGYSNHGLVNEALQVFKSMLESGSHPNSTTFLGILSACSHGGLVDRGWEEFNSMREVYAITPGLEHYICMIDLLGRAGKLEEAEDFVLRLPFKPNSSVWGALLGVCGLKKNSEIAARAAKKLLELDPLNAPAHVVLCNVSAANGQYLDEKILRKEMGQKGVRKTPGCSWIPLKGRVQLFLSGSKISLEADEMLSLLLGNLDERDCFMDCIY
ncbi:hypothetical protein EUGRSUZ_E00312 [Eucalyptus grandis]|uniref:Pentatricopeptide repeat-containing protein n=2 Tax=Eucalyptus grandis TaxID=71139 RepID=A0A059C0D5_EUCGR|nr:hypothetical protein EUGRSUZ_E00312 [Eucalyptus grandis]